MAFDNHLYSPRIVVMNLNKKNNKHEAAAAKAFTVNDTCITN